MHCREGLAFDVVAEQGRREGIGPSASSIQGDNLTLDTVHGGCKGHPHGLPPAEFGLIGGPADVRIGVVRQAPHGTHRQGAGRAGTFVVDRVRELDGDGQARGDVSVQLCPRRTAGYREMGGQVFLGL